MHSSLQDRLHRTDLRLSASRIHTVLYKRVDGLRNVSAHSSAQGILDLLVPQTVNHRVWQRSDDGVGH